MRGEIWTATWVFKGKHKKLPEIRVENVVTPKMDITDLAKDKLRYNRALKRYLERNPKDNVFFDKTTKEPVILTVIFTKFISLTNEKF